MNWGGGKAPSAVRRGRDSSRPQTLVPVCNSVCQPPHRILGGGVRRNLKLGEGVVTPSRGSGRQRKVVGERPPAVRAQDI
jgi:hypothetical protein